MTFSFQAEKKNKKNIPRFTVEEYVSGTLAVQFRHNFYLYIAQQNMNIGTTIYIHIQEYSVYYMYLYNVFATYFSVSA